MKLSHSLWSGHELKDAEKKKKGNAPPNKTHSYFMLFPLNLTILKY